MTITEIRQLLESPYNQMEWKVFLQSHFTNGKLFGNAHTIELTDKTICKKCYSLGNYEVSEYTQIGIFEVQLNDSVKLTRNRVGLRNLIKSITAQVAGAMVVFVQGDKWRFSYISKRKVKNTATNTIEDKETSPKRYTYLFGKGEKALTAAQRFDKLIQKQQGNLYQYLTLNDFEDAFSVEKLSKDFFKSYKEIYEDFVEFLTGKRFVKRGSKWTEVKTNEAHFQLRNYFDNNEKQARDFCKRMMGRIVFLYFIQKKGWLAVPKSKKWGQGNPDYLFELFATAKYKESFYSDYLVPLFFDTLNNANVQKESNEFRFPYLNGGLFDKSQDYRYDKIALPSEIFEKLFTTFNNFNFTIYEDAPDEHTVAVDPEMLGHIFENLLEDNKDKGAFYTPKEIVHYMCKESLKAYLFTHEEKLFVDNDKAKETIVKIIQQQELNEDERSFAEKNAYKIIDSLEQIKICDPAIGSGAFPMGLLQEIFNAQIYLQELKGFKKGITDADIKKHIIEESIYGVDIDAGAVDIARLRFWLSLVVEEEVPQPLPNLAFKIVCANTLIPLGTPKGDLSGSQEIAKQIEKLRHDYFDSSKEQKKELERQFKNLQNKLWNTAKEWVSKEDADIYLKISEFNPFEDKSCSWFDPLWMFGVKDGFDIVIGNPPYVQLQKNSGNLSKQFEKINYQTFERTGDIYSLFYERGWQLLKSKGVLCFITSNKWMRAGYGESTRKFFAENTNPLLLIDFAGQKIFEAATVDVNILMFTKDKNQLRTLACIVKDDVLNELSVFVSQQGSECKFVGGESWTILSPIEKSIKRKIEAVGTPLKDWDINIYRGILTGYNEAFIIDGATKDKLIKEDQKSAEIIRPILRGRDIKRYTYEFADLYLIATFPSLKIDIEKYPAVKKHLLSFGMERLEQTGKEQKVNGETIKARKKTTNKWFETQDSISYWDDFLRPKIIYPNMTKYLPFVYDDKEFLTNQKCFIITGKSVGFLTAFFNSSLFKYCFRENFPELQGGTRELSKIFFDKIPVLEVSDQTNKEFEKLVLKLQDLVMKQKSIKEIELEIDEKIFDLYSLTKEERKTIGFVEIQ